MKLPADPKKAKSFDADGAKKELRAHKPQVRFGTMASGSLVIDDKRKQKELLNSLRRMAATPREGT